jgi:hypothetical protein
LIWRFASCPPHHLYWGPLIRSRRRQRCTSKSQPAF